MLPTRELFWNINDSTTIYIFLVISFIFLITGIYAKLMLFRLGRPENRLDNIFKRIKSLVVFGLAHKRILQEKIPGLMHLWLFYGFVVLTAGTAIIALQDHLGLTLFFGNLYLILKLLLNVFGVTAITAVGVMVYRRYRSKPVPLTNSFDDAAALTLIMLILSTGFVLEGLRMYATGDKWALWCFPGWVLVKIFENTGLDRNVAVILHKKFWYGHMLMAFGFIGYLPYSKLIHLITSPANQFLRALSPKGTLMKLDLEEEEPDNVGVKSLDQFTWKQLLDAYACVRCGRCQEHCPAYLSGKNLSPRNLMQKLKIHLDEKGSLLLKLNENQNNNSQKHAEIAAANEKTQEIFNKSLVEEVFGKETVWDCTTCRSCEEHCPVFVENVNKVVDIRRSLVLVDSSFPAELQTLFRNIEKNCNPWGIARNSRGDWYSGLNVPTCAEKTPEVLYWVGCTGSYDDRNKQVSMAVIKLLQSAKVDFAVLGNKERCCGDSVRRLGNEYLFQQSAMENIETLNKYNVKTILTHCPHCYNTLKNEYPQFGGDYNVIHHTVFINNLLAEGSIKFGPGTVKNVVYHDPCYLGRYNDIYDAPRKVMEAIPGLQLLEMSRTLKDSLCCGAGGGRMWMEESPGKRVNMLRIQQALDQKPEAVITGCPHCLTMLADGAKALGADEKVRTIDLAELAVSAIQ